MVPEPSAGVECSGSAASFITMQSETSPPLQLIFRRMPFLSMTTLLSTSPAFIGVSAKPSAKRATTRTQSPSRILVPKGA